MLNNTGFDLWADGYDKSVGLSDENDRYPFAGYRAMMNALYQRVLAQSGRDVLDIGFGTGILTSRLYEQGCRIYGQDFSARMIELAQAKMPDARLYQGDFSKGLVPELCAQQYDAIVATYSLHHLTDTQKIGFLRTLLPLLKQDGCFSSATSPSARAKSSKRVELRQARIGTQMKFTSSMTSSVLTSPR